MARQWIVSAAFLLLVASGSRAETGYGDLTGRFVLDGEAPKPARLKEAALCAGEAVLAEDLIVDPKSGGIAHVFVFLTAKDVRGLKLPAELKESALKERTLDQKDCRFAPHAMVLRTDQTVRVTSNDPTTHNVHTYTLKNAAVNLLVPPSDRAGTVVRFTEPETGPIPVKCDIHPWMQAWWLVLDHPYAAVTDSEGRFQIEQLPAGEYSFRIWHERAGYLIRDWKVSITTGEVTDGGTVRIPIEKLTQPTK